MAITFVCKWVSKYKLLVCCAKNRIRVRLKVWVRLDSTYDKIDMHLYKQECQNYSMKPGSLIRFIKFRILNCHYVKL